MQLALSCDHPRSIPFRKKRRMARIELKSEVTGKVWKIEMAIGAQVPADEPVLLVESMKMEIPVTSTKPGRLVELRVAEGDPVKEGQVVAVLET